MVIRKKNEHIFLRAYTKSCQGGADFYFLGLKPPGIHVKGEGGYEAPIALVHIRGVGVSSPLAHPWGGPDPLGCMGKG